MMTAKCSVTLMKKWRMSASIVGRVKVSCPLESKLGSYLEAKL